MDKENEKGRKKYVDSFESPERFNEYLNENYHFRNEIKLLFKSTKNYNNNCDLKITHKLEKGSIVCEPELRKISCKTPYTTKTYVNGKERNLVFPNPCIYSVFCNTLSHTKHFENIKKISISDSNLMTIDFKKGDFADLSSNKFRNWVISKMQFKYEYLYKYDITKFYNSIYTHNFENIDKQKYTDIDKGIRNLKLGKTNGIIMGPITSAICANIIMDFLVKKIEKKLLELKKFEVYYFSDQIYIFSEEKIADLDDIVRKSLCDDMEYYYTINYAESGLIKLGDIIAEKVRIKDNEKKYLITSESKKFDFYNCFLNISNAITLGELENYREVKYYFGKIFAQVSEKIRFQKMLIGQGEYCELMRRNFMFIITQMPDLILYLMELGVTNILQEYYSKNSLAEKKEITDFCVKKLHDNLFGKLKDEIRAVYYYLLLTNIMDYIVDFKPKKINRGDHCFIMALIYINTQSPLYYCVSPFICNNNTILYSNSELNEKFRIERVKKLFKNIEKSDKYKTNINKLDKLKIDKLDDMEILKKYMQNTEK